MADASKLKPFILKWEGGFVNDPLDKGGATNKGVTLKTFKQFFGQDKTVDDLKKITDDQWLKIFKAGYWNPFKADEIWNQSIANICVDWAYNSGAATAIRKVQEVLGVKVDGQFGPKSLQTLNSKVPQKLFNDIKQKRIDFVNNIVKKNPTQAKFLKGWLNRINSLKFE